MKVYKATDKDMKCREFQYELGKAAEVKGDIELCERGLHACEMPCDFDNAINKADAENKNHATGLRGAASATGNGCVAMATGLYGRVMGEIGNAIVCVERKENGEIAAILSAVVDGKTLKPGVWYTVKNGRWQEVE